MTSLTFPITPAATAIIVNGARDAALAKYLPYYQQLIITDGAWQSVQTLLNKTHPAPDTQVLGDGDSIQHPPAHFIHLERQDNTDFAKALTYAINQQIAIADVFWAGGGEMDHFLGNLSTAVQFTDTIQLRFIAAQQSYYFLSAQTAKIITLHGVLGRTISLYPFPKACVTSTGLAYPLTQLKLNQQRQQSLRNRADADSVSLAIEGALWLFVSSKPNPMT